MGFFVCGMIVRFGYEERCNKRPPISFKNSTETRFLSFQMNLNQYYKHYVNLHQNPKCRLLHFLGQIATILFLIFIIYKKFWLMILIVPFIVYPFAWSGHYFFENNKPAAFSNPIYAKISDWIMFKEILLGRLSIW